MYYNRLDKNLSTEKNGKANMFNREKYLNQLIEKQHNNLVKVITGIRRSGKSYYTEEGFLRINLIEFLSNIDSLDW